MLHRVVSTSSAQKGTPNATKRAAIKCAFAKDQPYLTLWSIHPTEVWHALQQGSRIRGTPRRAPPHFLHSYLWMAEQMEKRLPDRRPAKALPIWAWLQYESVKRPKPDLRHDSLLPRGTRAVRLECHVPRRRVLLSGFQEWHYVLNYWYLPTSKTDDRRFERKLRERNLESYYDHDNPIPDAGMRQEIVHSWERIFDLTRNDWYDSTSGNVGDGEVQATLWELHRDDVVDVTEFTAR